MILMYHRSRDRAPGSGMKLEWGQLPGLFPEFEEAGRWLPLLEHHARLVDEAAVHTRVTSVEPEDVVRRHYAESLEVLRVAVAADGVPASMVDVGSGGGYPGLVAAAIWPETAVHLVEPLQKRARLLGVMAEAMGLRNVYVYPERAEDAGRGPLRERAALVTARAVAQLRELIEYTAAFAANGGLIALPKGSRAAAEVADAGRALAALGCDYERTVEMRPEVSDAGVVVLVRKVRGLRPKYPRKAGTPGRLPL